LTTECTSITFFLLHTFYYLDLLSFPTRRSSDLITVHVMCTVIFESRDKMSEAMIKIKLPLNYKKMNSSDKTFEKTYKKEIKNSEVSGYYKIFNALKYIMKWGIAFYIFMILIRVI